MSAALASHRAISLDSFAVCCCSPLRSTTSTARSSVFWRRRSSASCIGPSKTTATWLRGSRRRTRDRSAIRRQYHRSRWNTSRLRGRYYRVEFRCDGSRACPHRRWLQRDSVRTRPRRVREFSGVAQDGRRVVSGKRAGERSRPEFSMPDQNVGADHRADRRPMRSRSHGDGPSHSSRPARSVFCGWIPWLLDLSKSARSPPEVHAGRAGAHYERPLSIHRKKSCGCVCCVAVRRRAFAIGKLMTDPIWVF